uniref:Uncharacterized protein n=1 Tax=Psilocybe cubensis TaxID=181762 RepID=A0A8H8CHF2_PSICU
MYQLMTPPKLLVFVWGDKTNGRLGLPNVPKSVIRDGVPYPTQIPFSARIVSLVAGGMSFHALDSEGNVYVWGSLNGAPGTAHASDSHGFSSSWKSARIPHRLRLPSPIRSISCGRLHSSFLDRTNKIWTCTNWGRPFWLSSPILTDPDYAPKQVECGWMFSSLLTKSGAVFVWWPFSGSMGEAIQQKMEEMNSEGDKKAYATEDNLIPCIPWGVDIMPTRLPPIPTLPELANTTNTNTMTELIQIAAFDNHIVGLTNYGHVLKYGSLHDESGVPFGRWEYLPQFSEVDSLKIHTTFSGRTTDSAKLEAPHTIQITHLSANFLHFVAYSTGSSSIVLVGDTDTKPDTPPKIIPELQNKSIISVVIGDYHNAALTANGKLLTWGSYSNGALGLGDPLKLELGTPGAFANREELELAKARRFGQRVPPVVNTPTEVRFDHNSKKPRERFCFAATAAGWHTGALVIDLESGDDEAEEEQMRHDSAEAPSPSASARRQWETPPILPLSGIFRIGHAGRGNFGGGLGGIHPRGRNDGDTS